MADDELNGNGSLLASMPKWVRVIAYLGFPAAVAAYLLHFFVSTIGGTVNAQSTVLNQHVTESHQHDTRLEGFFTIHEQAEATTRAILAQICANGAKNNLERNNCFPDIKK